MWWVPAFRGALFALEVALICGGSSAAAAITRDEVSTTVSAIPLITEVSGAPRDVVVHFMEVSHGRQEALPCRLEGPEEATCTEVAQEGSDTAVRMYNFTSGSLAPVSRTDRGMGDPAAGYSKRGESTLEDIKILLANLESKSSIWSNGLAVPKAGNPP